METELNIDAHLPILQRCIIDEVPGKWEEIGIQLGFQSNKLENISDNWNRPKERMKDMLRQWLRRGNGTGDKPRTVQTLFDTLVDRSCRPEAELLEREFRGQYIRKW